MVDTFRDCSCSLPNSVYPLPPNVLRCIPKSNTDKENADATTMSKAKLVSDNGEMKILAFTRTIICSLVMGGDARCEGGGSLGGLGVQGLRRLRCRAPRSLRFLRLVRVSITRRLGGNLESTLYLHDATGRRHSTTPQQGATAPTGWA